MTDVSNCRYFNYRATQYLIEHGPVAFHNWFDPTVWYPLGRAVGFTIYPGLMWTAALVHWILNAIGIAANVRHVCVFLVRDGSDELLLY